MTFIRALAFSLLLVFLTGCQEDAKTSSAESAAPHATWFPLTIGDQQIRVQLAVEQAEMQHGLMFRQELAENDGMLFIFPRADARGFWMQNVDLPLDVGYINPQGVLREVYPMYPHNENTVDSRGSDIQFVLEMNQDWYKEHKVYPGAQIDLAQVSAAMKARGFEPRQYGLPE